MTGKTDFTPEEWELVLEAPTTAGTIVVLSERGGSIRESFSMAKAYSDARRQHGESELLDEVVSTKPKVDRTRHSSLEELREHGLGELRDAVQLLEAKATPEEVDDYRRFVLGLAERVAAAHKEGGQPVSDAERAAIAQIQAAMQTGGRDASTD
jgi:hypothetical protein